MGTMKHWVALLTVVRLVMDPMEVPAVVREDIIIGMREYLPQALMAALMVLMALRDIPKGAKGREQQPGHSVNLRARYMPEAEVEEALVMALVREALAAAAEVMGAMQQETLAAAEEEDTATAEMEAKAGME